MTRGDVDLFHVGAVRSVICDQAGCSSSTEKEGNELQQSYHAIVTYVGVVYGSFSASCVELIDWTNTANYDESAGLSNIIAE
jgi:hypothetical protein